MISTLGIRTTAIAPLAIVALFVVLIVSSDPTSATATTSSTPVLGCETKDSLGCGDIIMLEDFTNPRHKWKEMNDPVMGGKSTGTFTVDTDQKVGIFHGSVEIVSFLDAPGFVKAETTRGESWPDVSTCNGLRFALKSSTPSYKGFRVSFGHKRPPGSFPYIYGFKTDLHLPESDGTDEDEFQQIELPFDSFTDKWDAGSGDAIVTCKENNEFCPDAESLKDLYSIGVWGEGVEGIVDLQIRSISAYGCASDDANNSSDASDDGEDESSVVAIEDFSDPKHEWRTMNDPVMGGQSESSLELHDGMASFEGTCAIVPFLHAPGFITMTTGAHYGPGNPFKSLFRRSTTNNSNKGESSFPDVSSCKALSITVRSRDADTYEGYYVSFGTDRVPGGHHAMGYKTHFTVDSNNEFVELTLPFSDFSAHWDDATGKTTVTCEEDPAVCPTIETLRDMKTISFWAEGVEGTIALDIKYIGASGCDGEPAPGVSAAAGMVVGGALSNTGIERPCSLGMLAMVSVLVLLVARSRGRRGSRVSQSSEYVEVKQQAIVV